MQQKESMVCHSVGPSKWAKPANSSRLGAGRDTIMRRYCRVPLSAVAHLLAHKRHFAPLQFALSSAWKVILRDRNRHSGPHKCTLRLCRFQRGAPSPNGIRITQCAAVLPRQLEDSHGLFPVLTSVGPIGLVPQGTLVKKRRCRTVLVG